MTKSKSHMASQPALILMHGTSEKKHRPLDRDVVLVGRARGCDLGLEAPDISNLHCVIWRGTSGFQIRDCGSRAGIRINGDVVKEALLHDGDILQIGPFSFQVSLPPRPEASAREARLKHIERSRRNLARLALELRRRTCDLRGRIDSGAAGNRNLQRKASGLRRSVRDYEQRVQRLEQEERELSRDRDLLERERVAWQTQVIDAERELSRRRADADAEIQQQWQECRSRCQAEEDRLSSLQQGKDMRGDLNRTFATEDAASMEQQRAALEQAQAALREQRAELARMMSDLKAMHQTLRQQQAPDVRALQDENDQLRQRLEELEQAAQTDKLETLRADNERLVRLFDAGDAHRQELEGLRAENERLTRLLEEKGPAGPSSGNTDTFEAELNDYRRELETDRQKLNAEIQQLRQRNEELDEATREMEMELSRERAELARERTRLERLRDEVRVDLERLQRSGGVRDSLAPVQRLREEIAQRRGG